MPASELTTKELLAAAAIAISAVTGWIWMALLLWRGSMRLLAHTNWGHTAILACNEFLHLQMSGGAGGFLQKFGGRPLPREASLLEALPLLSGKMAAQDEL